MVEIFINERLHDYSKSLFVIPYHPQNLQHSKEHNSKQDRDSAILLALKDRTHSGYYFFNGEKIQQEYALDYFTAKLPSINKGVPVMVIPPSNPGNTSSGMYKLVKKIQLQGCRDATDCIVRSEKIPRDFSHNINNKPLYQQSLTIRKFEKFQKENVLLLDDVMTTGNSLHWVKELLIKNGAKNVACLALGYTTR